MATPDKIKKAVDMLRHADAKSYMRDGANEISLKMASVELAHHGYPALPDDYTELIRHAYGIMGPYFTLLGIGGMEMAGGGHQPGIIETSEAFNRWNDDDDTKTLVIGKMSGGVVITHKDGQYHIVDETSRDVFRSYADIADFITDTIIRLDKARQGAIG